MHYALNFYWIQNTHSPWCSSDFFNSDSRFLIHLRKWAKLIKFEAKYEHFYRVIFLTGPPLKMSLDWPPQKTPWLAQVGVHPRRPHFEKVLSMAAERGEIPNTLTFSTPRGGQSGTLTFFFKSVTYQPTLSKIRGGPVKKKTHTVIS